MAHESPDQQPSDGDFVPSPDHDSPSDISYMGPEALAIFSELPQNGSFTALPNGAKVALYKTDRFNRILGQKMMPELEAYIDSPESDIPREVFERQFSGKLSPRGFLLDTEGKETIYRPDGIARFRLQPERTEAALEAAYQQFTAERALGKAINEIDSDETKSE